MAPPFGRGKKGYISFAEDPHRLRCLPIPIGTTQWVPLSGLNHLSTTLIDYLLQRSLPENISDNVLVGSSDAFNFFKHHIKLLESTETKDKMAVDKLKKKYKYYSVGRYEFIGINCTHNHFFVITVGFDIGSELIFDNIKIYDSLKQTTQHNVKCAKSSAAANFLRKLQLFGCRKSMLRFPQSLAVSFSPCSSEGTEQKGRIENT
jgi:hypothetical protein